jgi:hypothetical protein
MQISLNKVIPKICSTCYCYFKKGNFVIVSGVFFKFDFKVGVEVSILNALYWLRITDQLFKSYVLHEWCVHNRLFNAYYEVKFKITTDIIIENLKIEI